MSVVKTAAEQHPHRPQATTSAGDTQPQWSQCLTNKTLSALSGRQPCMIWWSAPRVTHAPGPAKKKIAQPNFPTHALSTEVPNPAGLEAVLSISGTAPSREPDGCFLLLPQPGCGHSYRQSLHEGFWYLVCSMCSKVVHYSQGCLGSPREPLRSFMRVLSSCNPCVFN